VQSDYLANATAAEGPTNRRRTVLYLFFLVMREGLNRVRALNAPAVTLGGYRREHRYYDGTTIWKPAIGGAGVLQHPGGFQRRFDANAKRWYWDLNGQNQGYDTL